MSVEIQRLEREDYDVLKTIADGVSPDPDTCIALLAVDEGEIVGRIFLMAPAHVEGPWIREDRRSRTLGKKLMDSVEDAARKTGLKKLFAFGVGYKNEDYLQRLGYKRQPMTVWAKVL